MLSFEQIRKKAGPISLHLQVRLWVAILAICFCLLGQCALAQSSLKFAWPVPSRVTVTETALKKGNRAKMRYDVVISKQKSGNNLILSFEKYRFIEIGGIDLTTPENRQRYASAMAKNEAIAGMLPSLVINPQGVVVDVTGVDEMIEKSVDLFPAAEDSKTRATMLASMRSPGAIAMMKSKVQEFWQVWVETWADLSVLPDKEETYELGDPTSGKPSGTTMTVRNLGTDAPGKVKLSAQTVLQGAAAKTLLADLLKTLAPPEGANVPPLSADVVSNIKRLTRFSVVTNPRTLQPDWAQSEVITDCTIKGEAKSNTERRDYTFDWAARVEPTTNAAPAGPTEAAPPPTPPSSGLQQTGAKTFAARVKKNMGTWQIAAESYAADNDGIYPKGAKEMQPYLPGGGESINGNSGRWPVNPINAAKQEGLYDAGLRTSIELKLAREGKFKAAIGNPGQVGYSVLDGGRSYAIVGTDSNGALVQGPLPGSIFVCSNQ